MIKQTTFRTVLLVKEYTYIGLVNVLENVKGSFRNQGSPRVGGVCRLPEAVGRKQ